MGGAGNDSITNGAANVTIDGGRDNDIIRQYSSDASIVGGEGDDSISLTSYSQNNLIQYRAGDGNDSIVGFNGDDTLSIAGGTYSTQQSGSDIIVTVGNGKITLVGAASLSVLNIDGEEQFSDTLTLTNSDADKITLPAQIVTADASARTKAIRIVGNALDNSIIGVTGKDTLFGKDGDDYINGGDGNDKLYGNSGDDTLWGGAGNDTLTGGDGSDLFLYSTGKDVIADFSRNDTLQLGDGTDTYSKAAKGNDVVLTVGNGRITLKDAASLSTLNILGQEAAPIVTYDNSSSSKVTLAAQIQNGNASARTKAIRIVGNALDNSIVGGTGKDTLYGKDGDDYINGGDGNDKLYGQAGNDTLWGGAGNDTLTGGDGADVFLYADGEGNDMISDFDGDDLLQISGAFTTFYSLTDNSIVFKTANGSVALKNFTTTTFNVNGDTYVLGLSKR